MPLSPHFARTVAESTWLGVLSLDEFAPGLFFVSTNYGGMLAAVDDLVTCYSVGEELAERGGYGSLEPLHAPRLCT